MKGHLICVRELHRARDGPARTCSPHPRLPYVNATEPDAVAEPYSATVKRTKPARVNLIPAGANTPNDPAGLSDGAFANPKRTAGHFTKPIAFWPRRGAVVARRNAKREGGSVQR